VTAEVPVLIIGGGIGGMTTALALARDGFAAHIVEQSPAFGEIGAGIQLAPNALRILDRLGVLPELAALAVRPRRLVLMHADRGEHLTTVSFGEPFERRYGYPYSVMHRGDLLTVLYQACRADERITLESGREVTGLADQGDLAQVRFADGGSWSVTTARSPTSSSPTAARCLPVPWGLLVTWGRVLTWSCPRRGAAASRSGRKTRSSGSGRTSTWCSTRSGATDCTTRWPYSAARATRVRPS
jgi:FAD binding domain-containing protein